MLSTLTSKLIITEFFSLLEPLKNSLHTLGRETSAGTAPFGDKHLRRLLWYLLGGTRGGPNRLEIIKTLNNRPSNANQLAELMRVDYKTVQHHLRVLEENGLIAPSQKGAYGAVFFLTPRMEEALPVLDEIWSKIGRSKISVPRPSE